MKTRYRVGGREGRREGAKAEASLLRSEDSAFSRHGENRGDMMSGETGAEGRNSQDLQCDFFLGFGGAAPFKHVFDSRIASGMHKSFESYRSSHLHFPVVCGGRGGKEWLNAPGAETGAPIESPCQSGQVRPGPTKSPSRSHLVAPSPSGEGGAILRHSVMADREARQWSAAPACNSMGAK
jgi:hypothetical protein